MFEIENPSTPQSALYQELQDSSRVWIYQSNREFSEMEVTALRRDISRFTKSWVSHNHLMTALGDVLYKRFIVLMVDESYVGAGGCSIDTSIKFLRHIEEKFDVELFDRMTFAWLEDEEVRTAPKEEFARLYNKGVLTNDTPVFDNIVNTKADFEKGWIKPLSNSWHKKII